MPQSDVLVTLTGEPRQMVTSGAATDESLATNGRHKEKQRQEYRTAWQNVIFDKLIQWGQNPTSLDDGLIIPPTRPAVDVASQLALFLRDKEAPPPQRVAPDGDGGIVFDRWSGTTSVSFEISSAGTIEFVELRNHRVVSRSPISLEQVV